MEEPEYKRARHDREGDRYNFISICTLLRCAHDLVRDAPEEDVNPYGIKPEGNLFDCDVAMENRLSSSLGAFRRVQDKTILHVES
eukprot:767205-Hanusia_phi.AAC.2